MTVTFHILVSDSLSTEGISLLKSIDAFHVDVQTGLTPAQLLEVIPNYHALLVRSSTQVTKEVIEKGTQLRLIGRAGIGTDNIDVAAALKAGIKVMNTPDGNTVTTAEHAISLLMSLARNIPQATASLKAGQWEKSAYKGTEIRGKTLGLIGFGKIGSIVASLAQGLQMKVVAHDPLLTTEKAAEHKISLSFFDDLLAQSDFISIHAPLIPKTHHLINAEAFSKMKKGVFLINAARGGIVDENALLMALESGKVKGAALDVFEQEPPAKDYALLGHPRVIATPHLGASTTEAQDRVALQLAEQTYGFFLKNELRNCLA